MSDESPDVTLDDELAAPKFTVGRDKLLIPSGIPGDAVAGLMVAGVIYVRTFLETLAKHHADALINAVGTRIHRNGKTEELLVGPEDGSAARVLVTGQTPDEARLALLDLDVTAEDMRGKILRWDEKAMAWRPDDSQD